MALIRPRLTDFHGIDRAQSDLDFAIPLLDEDIPLHVDPFLLWKSPSYQDHALHTSIINSFNHLGVLAKKGRQADASRILVGASECEEVGLGVSATRKGKRISLKKANEILSLFLDIPHYKDNGFTHFEELQLYIGGIAKDRISDFTCTFLKSFLIDYSTQCCEEVGIPLEKVTVKDVYSYKDSRLEDASSAWLPVNPETGKPVLLVPRRWLRFSPWINFEEYFKDYCPRDEISGGGELTDPALVLRYNRDNYDFVRGYIESKERTQSDCKNDPLFSQLPVVSAKRKLSAILRLPSGKTDNADRKYEDTISQLLASLLYPHLDFAAEQVRTESGVLIRDLVFYNNRKIEFLQEIHADYGNRQLVFEMKNVASIDRDNLNQMNRYLDSGLGKFGVLLTRNELTKPMLKNTIDLWSGQRKCVIALTDEDLKLMVDLFESHQRPPIDVLKKKYVEFRRLCPS